MSIEQVFERLNVDTTNHRTPRGKLSTENNGVWVGSIGYERYKLNTDFAAQLRAAGVERLIDVRQLPISRRRGYAKSALSAVLSEYGVEYIHMRSLGNPKPTRDLYKSGNAAEGRAGYTRYLLDEQREALALLAEHLSDRRCALMCVEHDVAVCHRDVIFSALRNELGLDLDVAEIC